MADQPNTTSAADELITAPAPPKPLDMKLLQAGDAAETLRFQQMGQAAALTDEQRLAQIANGVPLAGPSVSVGQQLTDADFSGAVENLLGLGLNPVMINEVISGKKFLPQHLQQATWRKEALLADAKWVASWLAGDPVCAYEMTLCNSIITGGRDG